MGRRPRIDIPNLLYHVVARGNYQQDIFYSDADRELYLELLAFYKEKLGFTVYAFCLMSNHVHLLLRPTEKSSLAEIVKSLHSRYAKKCNYRQKQRGHLFQERFYSVVVDSEAYLLELTRYIHLNAVRAGITSKPQDYKWSSLRTYIGLDYYPFIDRSHLTLFGKRPSTQVSRYMAFLEQGLRNNKDILSEIKEGRFLGSDGFIAQVKAILIES
ncbi:MAG: transposase [Firmicutes bacterium]|nr:transposase [Bacillota bacterium]